MCTVLSSSAISKHWLRQLYRWWQREGKTLQHPSMSVQLFVGTFVSIQVEGGATARPWLADWLWEAEGRPLYSLRRNRLLAVLSVFLLNTQEMQTGRDKRVIRQRGRAELITEDRTELEDEDLVSLDGVEVVVHGEEDLGVNTQRVSCLHIPISTVYSSFIIKISDILDI